MQQKRDPRGSLFNVCRRQSALHHETRRFGLAPLGHADHVVASWQIAHVCGHALNATHLSLVVHPAAAGEVEHLHGCVALPSQCGRLSSPVATGLGKMFHDAPKPAVSSASSTLVTMLPVMKCLARASRVDCSRVGHVAPRVRRTELLFQVMHCRSEARVVGHSVVADSHVSPPFSVTNTPNSVPTTMVSPLSSAASMTTS